MAENALRTPESSPLYAKRRFLEALPERLVALAAALDNLLEDPTSEAKRQLLARRLGAMADAAHTLGLEQLAPAFTSAQSALDRAGDDSTDRAFGDVREILTLAPSLCPSPDAAPKSAPTPVLSPETQAPSLEPASPSTLGVSADHGLSADHALSADPTAGTSTARSGELVRAPERPETPAPVAAAQPRRVLAPRRPTTVIALGVLALREQVRTWERGEPETTFEFTVDLEDARDLANCDETPLFIIDARRRDAQRALSTLSQLGACLAVEATAEQAANWKSVERVSVASSPEQAAARIASLLRGSAAAPAAVAAAQLPQVAVRQHVSARRQSPSASTLPNRRVLIADADPATAWFLSGVLRAAHAEVLEAKDGLEAWSIAQRWYPDLIVADMTLDGLDGFGLCRNIKRDVALSDIPLMLLARKREQLQRARELGAGADAYLIKEAHAPMILKRCTEVLQSRADVEQRIRSEQAFRGRLDGMTPHTVLRLSCELVGTATVTFEDAGYEFVATVADGRLFNVERRLPGGGRLDGLGAAAALLGMRAGSFRIERGCDSPQAAFSGSLSHALAPTLERTRRAMRVLQGDALNQIAHLEINRSNVTPYIDASPAVVKKIVAKLQAGVAPAALLRSISPGLLESVLTDLALRGGIESAVSRNGSDLLDDHDVFSQPFDLDLRTPTGGFEMVAAAGAPLVDRHSTYEDALEAAAFAEGSATPFDDAASLRPSATATSESRPSPGRSDVFRAPPLSERGSNDEVEAQLRAQPDDEEHPAPNQLATRELNDQAQPTDHDLAGESELVTLEPADGAERRVRKAESLKFTLGTQSPHTQDTADDSADTPLDGNRPTATSQSAKLQDPDDSPDLTAPPEPAPSAATEDPPESSDLDLGLAVFSATSATPSTLPPHANPKPAASRKVVASPETAAPPTPTPLSVQGDSRADAPKQETAPRERARDELLLSDSLTESERLPDIDMEADDDPLFDSLVSGRGFADSSSVNLSPVAYSDEPPPKHVARRGRRSRNSTTAATAPQSQVATTPSLNRPPERPPIGDSTNDRIADKLSTGAKKAAVFTALAKSWLPRPGARKKVSQTTNPEPTVLRERAIAVSRVAKRTVLPIVAVMGAATLTFTGMGLLVDKLQADKTEPPELLQPADGIAAHPATLNGPEAPSDETDEPGSASIAPPGTKSKHARVDMTTTDLPLPNGIDVGAGKGLLEINSAGKHKIYVEGVFIGRGPVRRVPLQAGAHKVTMRKDGDENTSEVVVTSGRRVRLEPRALANASSPR